MAKYQCIKCNYKIEPQNKPLRCPFCGSEATLRPVPTAEDLLKDSEREEISPRKLETKDIRRI